MTKHPNDAKPSEEGNLMHGHFDVQKSPFYWLTKAYGRYIAEMELSLKEVELDIPRWRVLMLLEEERARSISYLAQEAIAKLSTMTRIVQRMQQDGLLITRPRASDQRVTEALLTVNGRRARLLALQKADDIYTRALGTLPSADVDALNASLSKIHTNLE